MFHRNYFPEFQKPCALISSQLLPDSKCNSSPCPKVKKIINPANLLYLRTQIRCMQLVQQIAFILLSLSAIGLFTRNALRIRKNILLEKNEDFSDHPAARWKNLLLLAFGQKKMFRNPL